MTFEELVKEKIPNLSIGQSKVAGYIINNLETFSYLTLSKLSREIEVSETTIIRLAYSLGFESFSNMQSSIRKELLSDNSEDNIDDIDCKNKQIIMREIECLEKISTQFTSDKFDSVANVIMKADMVLSLGSRAAYFTSAWFAQILGSLKPKVFAVNAGCEDNLSYMLDVTKDTILFCISFSRYSRATHRYASMAKERGAKIIAITDNTLSPIGLLADYLFVVDSIKDKIGFNSYVSALTISNVILSNISMKNEGIPLRVKKLEDIYKKTDIFYE